MAASARTAYPHDEHDVIPINHTKKNKKYKRYKNLNAYPMTNMM